MDQGSTSYLKLVGILFLTMFVSIVSMNYFFNPYFVFGLDENDFLTEYKHKVESRKGKSELLLHQSFDVLILGTSRAEIGFAPDDIETGTAFNGALSGCLIAEAEAMFNLAVKKQPDLKKVILVTDLISANDLKVRAETAASLLNPELSVTSYYFQSLFGYDTTIASLEMLKYSGRGDKAKRNIVGFKHDATSPNESTRSLSDRTLHNYSYLGGTYTTFEYNIKSLSSIRSMVDICKQNDIELILIIPPLHAELQYAVYALKKWDTFDQFKRDLVSIVYDSPNTTALWDFSGFSSYTTEELSEEEWKKADSMQWYMDIAHFKSTLGKIMLDRVNGNTAESNFGVRLNPENLNTHLLTMRDDVEQWGKSHQQEVAHIDEIRHQARRPAKEAALF